MSSSILSQPLILELPINSKEFSLDLDRLSFFSRFKISSSKISAVLSYFFSGEHDNRRPANTKIKFLILSNMIF